MCDRNRVASDIDFIEDNRIVDITERGTRSSSDETRVTDHYGTVRHVKVDVSARSDKYVITDRYITDDDRIRTDPNIVTDGRRTLPLTTELGTDDNACGDIDVIADDRLRMDDDTAEMGKIKTLADLCVIRDLNVIFTGETVQIHVEELKLKLVKLLPPAVISLSLTIVVLCTPQSTDITELRAGSDLFYVCQKNPVMASLISCITIQIAIDDVLQFVIHAKPPTKILTVKIIFLISQINNRFGHIFDKINENMVCNLSPLNYIYFVICIKIFYTY